MRQREGTEEARELATHAPGTASIYTYDNVGMADKDITSVRLGVKADNREENSQSLRSSDTSKCCYRQTKAKRQRCNFFAESEMKDFVRWGCEADAACIAASRGYRDFFKELSARNDGYDASTYQARRVIDSFNIDNDEKAKLHTSLDEVQRDRKSVFRQATRRYVELFQKSKIEEYKESTTTLEKGLELEERIIMARDLSISKKKIIDKADDVMNLTPSGEWSIDISKEPENEGERSQLEDRISQLFIFIKAEEDTIYLSEKKLPTSQTETEITTVETVTKNSGSSHRCHLCLFNNTFPVEKKEKFWRLRELDIHLSTDYHSRLSVLKRTVANELKLQGSGKLSCPICEMTNEGDDEEIEPPQFATAFKMVGHLTKAHNYE
ncbi:hypothetical protein BPAE_0069g00010 [Botrytis paeoniae]|uniref:Uncharacterized protein n=1 Tax=Botrytis paeoniae TaxID=278948 RepID=A0A4Z1FSJ9_9HELO|nr:hypothetical protein BPAE_0069g00010 [Botrytis paeoniae]